MLKSANVFHKSSWITQQNFMEKSIPFSERKCLCMRGKHETKLILLAFMDIVKAAERRDNFTVDVATKGA